MSLATRQVREILFHSVRVTEVWCYAGVGVGGSAGGVYVRGEAEWWKSIRIEKDEEKGTALKGPSNMRWAGL